MPKEENDAFDERIADIEEQYRDCLITEEEREQLLDSVRRQFLEWQRRNR